MHGSEVRTTGTVGLFDPVSARQDVGADARAGCWESGVCHRVRFPGLVLSESAWASTPPARSRPSTAGFRPPVMKRPFRGHRP